MSQSHPNRSAGASPEKSNRSILGDFERAYMPVLMSLAMALLATVGLAPQIIGLPANLSEYYIWMDEAKTSSPSPSIKEKPSNLVVAILPQDVRCPYCNIALTQNLAHICSTPEVSGRESKMVEAIVDRPFTEDAVAVKQSGHLAPIVIPKSSQTTSSPEREALSIRYQFMKKMLEGQSSPPGRLRALKSFDEIYHSVIEKNYHVALENALRHDIVGLTGSDREADEFLRQSEPTKERSSYLHKMVRSNTWMGWWTSTDQLLIENEKRIQTQTMRNTLGEEPVLDKASQNRIVNKYSNLEPQQKYRYIPTALLWVLLWGLSFRLLFQSVYDTRISDEYDVNAVLHFVCILFRLCVPVSLYLLIFNIFVNSPSIVSNSSTMWLLLVIVFGFMTPLGIRFAVATHELAVRKFANTVERLDYILDVSTELSRRLMIPMLASAMMIDSFIIMKNLAANGIVSFLTNFFPLLLVLSVAMLALPPLLTGYKCLRAFQDPNADRDGLWKTMRKIPKSFFPLALYVGACCIFPVVTSSPQFINTSTGEGARYYASCLQVIALFLLVVQFLTDVYQAGKSPRSGDQSAGRLAKIKQLLSRRTPILGG